MTENNSIQRLFGGCGCNDFEDFIATECKLNYDYDEYSPGIKTKTWDETLDAVVRYVKDPSIDSDWRCRIRDEFYDMSANDEHNFR